MFILEFIMDTVVAGLGVLTKKLFGMPPSKSGISEMWIGALAAAAILVIGIWLVRR
jgi:hypothetical protein